MNKDEIYKFILLYFYSNINTKYSKKKKLEKNPVSK